MTARPEKPVIVLGGGGHARVLLDMLQQLDVSIIGVTTADGKGAPPLPGVNILGTDDVVTRYSPTETQLVNAVGVATASDFRKRLHEKFAAQGYSFPMLIHPRATVSRFATLDEGCQIMAGCVIQAGARIGRGTIVNTMVSVDHDCCIGNFVHIAPGAHLSGRVTVGDCSLIGTGSSVVQEVRIGAMCTIGAGSAVIRDIVDGTRVGGSPARPLPRDAQE